MTEEQRQRARALLGQAALSEPTSPVASPPRPVAPGTLPSSVQQLLQGMPPERPYLKTYRGIQFPAPPEQAERELRMEAAKRLLKESYPTSTALERRGTKIARVALKSLRDIRELLQVDEKKGVVKNREPISVTHPLTQYQSQFYMTPAQKKLRDRLNKTWDLLAMLRTGVAGEYRQKSSLMGQSNIGEFDDDSTIIDRIKQLEAESRAFGTGELSSPVDEKNISDEVLKQLLQNE